MVRSFSALVVLASGMLIGCGPSQMGASNPDLAGSTGYFDENHVDYLHNGDAYIVRRQKELEANPAPAPAAGTELPKGKRLLDRVSQFEMLRYNATAVTTPVLFGATTYQITVYFTEGAPAVFKGSFGKDLAVSAKVGGLTLEGQLRDYSSPDVPSYLEHDRSTGVLYLSDAKTKERLEISYKGLKKKHEDLPDREASLSPGMKKQLEQLAKTTLWENDWTVLGGKSFYLNDFILPQPGSLKAMVALRGESKRTSTADNAYEFAAEALTKDTVSDALLVGNSEEGGKRAFQVTLEDETTKEKHNVLIYTEPEHIDPSDDVAPAADVAYGAPERTDAKESVPPFTESTGLTFEPDGAKSQVTSGGAFLPIHRDLKLTALMNADLNQNRRNPGVLRVIAEFQKGSERNRLQNFFDYAYPFRNILSAISRAFDSNPIYVYLTVDESAYFSGRRYQIDWGDNHQALGPFQLHVAAATETKVLVGRGVDERAYLTASACGGARYITSIAQTFANKKMDTTLALFGYNRGPAKALQYAHRYGAKWAMLDSARAGVPGAWLHYVNSKIAIYLIANNRRLYQFPEVSGNEKKSLPKNNTVVPPSGIHDPLCRSVVAPYLGST